MAETFPSPHAHEVHKKPSNPTEKFFMVQFPHLVNTPQGKELIRRHESEKNMLNAHHLEAKQQVRWETQEKISTVRPLKLSDIRSLVGLAHYIKQSDDRWMQALEQEIGLDNTWKILALTGAQTIVKVLETFVDILKIGEGVGKWANALSDEELSKWERAGAIANGIGTDGFRALGITGAIGSLGKVLKNMEPSENLIGMEPKMGDYMAFGKQRGAVGERLKPVTKAEVIDPLALTQILEKTPKEYGELLHFELAKLWDPTQNLEHIFRGIKQNEAPDLMKMINENANRWLSDMLGNINNLVRYLEQYPDRARLRGWREGQKYDTTITNALTMVMNDIKIFGKEKWFQISSRNAKQLVGIIKQIKSIPN